jgi:hypothetical protein
VGSIGDLFKILGLIIGIGLALITLIWLLAEKL